MISNQQVRIFILSKQMKTKEILVKSGISKLSTVYTILFFAISDLFFVIHVQYTFGIFYNLRYNNINFKDFPLNQLDNYFSHRDMIKKLAPDF